MEKKLLYEVSIIRPLIILLLVITHSFAIYSDGWKTPEGVEENYIYYWLVKIITGFRIETIALIGGYVFSFQSNMLKRKTDFQKLFFKKFKRLIIPCLFFSSLYFFIFKYNPENFNLFHFIVGLFSGYGHMWFLPMLFWCFLIIWFLDRKKYNEKIVLSILLFCSILPIPSLPFGFGRLPHFMLFFYVGYLLYIYKDRVIKFGNIKIIILSIFIYIVLVPIYNECRQILVYQTSLFDKALCISLSNIIKIPLSLLGIFIVYTITCKKVYKPGFKVKAWVINASSICYGVYIYHQFILQYLYYYTTLPQNVSSIILPWIVLIITIIISIILSSLTLKTRIGRFLIG